VTVAPIDCRSAMRELWDYLDDELPLERTDQIREHLATCHGCSSHVEFCRAFLVQIDRVPVAPSELSRMREKVSHALRGQGLTRR
jgi:anti-sigma factor RsiW